MQRLFSRITLLSVIVLAAAGSASAQVYVKVRPVAPAVVRPAAPGRGYVWIGEEWEARGGGYVYAGGHWARPPHPGWVWVPGHWRHRGHYGEIWVPGRWRRR